jgi:hypothetical protein
VTRNWNKVVQTVLEQLADKGVALAWETEMAVSDFHDAAPSSATTFEGMPTPSELRGWLWTTRDVPSLGLWAYAEGTQVRVGHALPIP